MLYALQCAGACNNGAMAFAEKLTRDAIKTEEGRPLLSDYELSMLRRLKYTPHEMTGFCQARCTECKTLRRYGSF